MKMRNVFITAAACIILCFCFYCAGARDANEIYYQPAEIISAYTNGNATCYAFVCTENKNDGNVFIWETESVLTDDIPYLLTMDSKGTETIVDDEILVVWGCMN